MKKLKKHLYWVLHFIEFCMSNLFFSGGSDTVQIINFISFRLRLVRASTFFHKTSTEQSSQANVFLLKWTVTSCNLPLQLWVIVCRNTGWLWIWFFFSSLLFIVNCLSWIESSLSFPLFLFSWHSGENPEFLMKCKTWHLHGDILERSQLQSWSFPAALICTDNWNAERPPNSDDICCKTRNVCNFLNIILDWPALFQMCVQTMYTDEWPREGIPAPAQWNGLCRPNWICGPVQTIQGFEQIVHALELDEEEEQHRREWGLCGRQKVWRPPKPDLWGPVPVGEISWVIIT